MLEKLKEIDTKAIKSLVTLKQERSQVKGFLEKAEELKKKVDGSVYDRVKRDYETRHAELDMKAVPLKDEGRAEYAKLQSLRAEIEVAHQAARADKEELEFRNAVGELPDKDLQLKLKDVEKLLAQRETELAEAEKLKQQFLEAFDSEAELESDDGSAFEDEDEEEAAAADDGDPFEDEDEDEDDDRGESETRTGYEVEANQGDLDRTGILQFREPDDSAPPGGVETFILPVARLISIDEEGGEGEHYPLGAFNYIGRTEENQIRITLPGVSRKHALLKATPAGFVIEDLKSHNGTFVNDERIDERHLEDGDLIAVGNVRLLFRTAESA